VVCGWRRCFPGRRRCAPPPAHLPFLGVGRLAIFILPGGLGGRRFRWQVRVWGGEAQGTGGGRGAKVLMYSASCSQLGACADSARDLDDQGEWRPTRSEQTDSKVQGRRSADCHSLTQEGGKARRVPLPSYTSRQSCPTLPIQRPSPGRRYVTVCSPSFSYVLVLLPSPPSLAFWILISYVLPMVQARR
jgi:hypothetical protein